MLFYTFFTRKLSKWSLLYKLLILLVISLTIFLLQWLQQYTIETQYTQSVLTIGPKINTGINENSSIVHESSAPFITRGLIAFYPDHQEEHFFPELLWLYHTWSNMMKYEPLSWRTDLVLYTKNITWNLDRLGCIHNRIRVDRNEPPKCRVFSYQRINSRNSTNTYNADDHPFQQYDHKRSMLLKQYLDKYDYLDSINVIAECYPSFAMYDYILRTDLDVFLTPYFGRFVPLNNTLIVGGGGYSTAFNTRRLRRIAANMNWQYANLTNIGSTW